jgi:hypothetical protein
MMNDYLFLLTYRLPPDVEAGAAVERLGAAGCTDALIGIGIAGRLALEFDRTAASALDAITSAIKDVHNALPLAELIDVGPDLVGLSDIADFVGVSRQNIRKLMVGTPGSPLPIHEGTTTLWPLVEVLDWLTANKGYAPQPALRETALTARSVNMERQRLRLDIVTPTDVQRAAG